MALIVVALREAVDTTVRTESDVEDLLSAPVLASVRSLPRRAKIVTFGRHEGMFGDTYALLAAQLAPESDEKIARVLAVTSALAREGKTTTATNLAIAAARRGINVMLADFDFRKPAMSDLLGIPRETGGALQVLAGSMELEQVIWQVSLDGPRPSVSPIADEFDTTARSAHTDLPGFDSNGHGDAAAGQLRVLPSGGSVPRYRLAPQARLSALLRDLRSRAELVIVDTPPALLTVEMTELAQLIDVVLVVVRQGRVSQRTLRSLGRHARGWRAEVAGAVLTDVQAPAGERYAYYGSR
jgi:Mrp family chromosome partitioning ATPase